MQTSPYRKSKGVDIGIKSSNVKHDNEKTRHASANTGGINARMFEKKEGKRKSLKWDRKEIVEVREEWR